MRPLYSFEHANFSRPASGNWERLDKISLSAVTKKQPKRIFSLRTYCTQTSAIQTLYRSPSTPKYILSSFRGTQPNPRWKWTPSVKPFRGCGLQGSWFEWLLISLSLWSMYGFVEQQTIAIMMIVQSSFNALMVSFQFIIFYIAVASGTVRYKTACNLHEIACNYGQFM